MVQHVAELIQRPISWFEGYVFEIAARRSALPAELQAALDTVPIVLPAWDPMGALAR